VQWTNVCPPYQSEILQQDAVDYYVTTRSPSVTKDSMRRNKKRNHAVEKKNSTPL